jgi:hypothetical protein
MSNPHRNCAHHVWKRNHNAHVCQKTRFERFCLTAGIGAIEQMLCDDAQQLVGTRHNRGAERNGPALGHDQGKGSVSMVARLPCMGSPPSSSKDSLRCSPSTASACLVKLRRSLACTNSIENMMGTVRRVWLTAGLATEFAQRMAWNRASPGERQHC